MNPSLPKYLQISQEIEKQINAGFWENGKIPSVRGIAAEHKVSVVTASRALQVLRDKGLINAVERSGCYLVERDTAPAEKWALCARVTPGPWQRATESIIQAGFDRLAREQGVQIDNERFDFDENISDREMQRKLRIAKDEGIRGIFMMPSRLNEQLMHLDELFLRACESVGVPVILLERNLRGNLRELQHDLVASDDLAGGRECTNHLLNLGRRRVAFVMGSPTSSHYDRLAGYLHSLYAFSGEKTQKLQPVVLWQDHTLPNKQGYAKLADEITKIKPDGIICYQDYAAMGLILELLSRGIKIPSDLSIVGFDNLPIGNMFAVGVTTYEFPSYEIANQSLRMMRERIQNPNQPPVKVVVAGRLIIRESSIITKTTS